MNRIFKRLANENDYEYEEENDEIIENFNISNLLVSSRALRNTYNDICHKQFSRTEGPLDIWIDNDENYILVDGYHRFIEMLFKSIETTTIRIVGHGYTDYWATPRDPFVVDFSLKFNGLEEFCDDEVLQDDYDELFKNR